MDALEAPAVPTTNGKFAIDACAMCMYGGRMASHPPSGRTRKRRPIQLAALRGFDAAARHLSFTLAADELALTQSSVSRQMSALERQVGKPLFVRKTRALELTAAGVRLQRAVRQALVGIDQTIDEIRGASGPTRMTLTTYASFASLWLVPRLATFQRAHPAIEIRIDAADRVVDIEAEDMDLAIRWSQAGSFAAGAVPLGEDVMAPAMSAKLLATAPPLTDPGELARWPLMDFDDTVPGSMRVNWAHWFEFAGAGLVEPGAGRLVFSFVDQAVQAAVRGQGVALVRTPFLQDVVASGELVMPFPKLLMPTGYRHLLIVNPMRARLPHVALFCDWLIDEFKRIPQIDA
jgi:DNA-binding transcriptional LysR family regulator